MPKPRASKLETPSSRARLTPRKKPYYVKVAPGIHLGNAGPGTWSVRVASDGSEWLKKIGLADDLEPAAPPVVLSYWQALQLFAVARSRSRLGVAWRHLAGGQIPGPPLEQADQLFAVVLFDPPGPFL
jgi:hypothetical protein